jgi:YaaC-like Protein
VVDRVPQYRYHREHWLIPSIRGRDELSPLLLWWSFIFGLSLLVRYEPTAWRAALDPDHSQLAVLLEQVLDVALEVTPDLLYEAVTHEPALLPPRR